MVRVPVALRPRSEGRDPWRVARCCRQVHSFLKQGSFDLVHSHGYFADIVSIPSARLLGIPHVSTCHGFITSDLALKLYTWLDRAFLRCSSRVIAVSEEMRRDLVRRGLDARRVVTVPNAVAVPPDGKPREKARTRRRAELGVDQGTLLVGYVGRLSVEKGVAYLLEACAALHPRVALVVLLLGEGPERDRLQEQAVQAGMEDRVIFAGFRRDVLSWLPALDVFVLPSLTEGTPLSLLEAMAAGLPAAATAVGGVPQVLEHGRNGLLLAPGNARAIADALERLAADEGLRRELSQQARQTVLTRFPVADWVGRIEQEYETLLAGDRRQAAFTG